MPRPDAAWEPQAEENGRLPFITLEDVKELIGRNTRIFPYMSWLANVETGMRLLSASVEMLRSPRSIAL